jgi:hypothetical protein
MVWGADSLNGGGRKLLGQLGSVRFGRSEVQALSGTGKVLENFREVLERREVQVLERRGSESSWAAGRQILERREVQFF